jgi:hypothetical protein
VSLDINATPGHAAANSFVSVDDADAYTETRLNASAWTDADDDDKSRALQEATRDLNALQWDGGTNGQRVSSTQSLACNATSCYFDSTTIPQWLQDATCELALEFLRAGTTDVANNSSKAGIIEKTVGPLTTRWSDRAIGANDLQGLLRFRSVWRLVSRYVVGSSGSVRLVR